MTARATGICISADCLLSVASHLVKHKDFVHGTLKFLKWWVDGIKGLLQHAELALPTEVFLRAEVDEEDTHLPQLRHPRCIMPVVNLCREQSSGQGDREVLRGTLLCALSVLVYTNRTCCQLNP